MEITEKKLTITGIDEVRKITKNIHKCYPHVKYVNSKPTQDNACDVISAIPDVGIKSITLYGCIIPDGFEFIKLVSRFRHLFKIKLIRCTICSKYVDLVDNQMYNTYLDECNVEE